LSDEKPIEFIKAIHLATIETVGCEVVSTPLNEKFNSGFFVAKSNHKNFYCYNLDKVLN
jgi:3-phytase